MNRKILSRWILSYAILCVATDISHAAGMLMRVQQMKSMKQRQGQQMTQEEYQQYQQAQQAQQAQQQGGQPQGQQAPAEPTYQQKVEQRNQDIAQAILDAHNPLVSAQAVPSDNIQAVNSQPENSQPVNAPIVKSQTTPSSSSQTAQDVVDLTEVWKKLDTKSTVWSLLIDEQSKLLTVSEYIDRYQKQGVKISAPPKHYVKAIDQIVNDNPDMLNRPFGELLQIMAIVDYDFDNGMNKDDLARKVLGQAGFEANKRRFQ